MAALSMPGVSTHRHFESGGGPGDEMDCREQ